MAGPFDDGGVWGTLFSQEVKTFVNREITKLRDELRTEFAQQLETIEKNVPRYCGVHVQGQAYSKGALVTHGGSLWVCRALETGSTPGSDANWQLCVKAGTFSK